jgi:hypothetical protein
MHIKQSIVRHSCFYAGYSSYLEYILHPFIFTYRQLVYFLTIKKGTDIVFIFS